MKRIAVNRYPKKCPFCGRTPHMQTVGALHAVSCSGSWWGVPGKGCGALGPYSQQEWRAVKAWNRRTP